MRDDLGQIELRGGVLVEQVADLVGDIGVRVGPAAEQQPRLVLPDRLTELPRVLDAPRRPDALVAAEDHQRLEPLLDRATFRRRRSPRARFVRAPRSSDAHGPPDGA